MTAASLLHLLSEEDYAKAVAVLGSFDRLANPDVIIAPDGSPYIYRWHVIPRNAAGANVYFHIQVQSDPERPLHDHPWDNVSHLLSGGYVEIIQECPPYGFVREVPRRAGDVIFRKAEAAHRLILPKGVPYIMSLFTTGPVVREWGFWFGKPHTAPGNRVVLPKWLVHDECIVLQPDGRSLFHPPEV